MQRSVKQLFAYAHSCKGFQIPQHVVVNRRKADILFQNKEFFDAKEEYQKIYDEVIKDLRCFIIKSTPFFEMMRINLLRRGVSVATIYTVYDPAFEISKKVFLADHSRLGALVEVYRNMHQAIHECTSNLKT